MGDLTVIGAGLGRTGTLSLKAALEELGLGPSYHMYEVLGHVDHAPAWVTAARGGELDLSVLSGYRSTVDWPGCAFWRELVEAAPEAQVVLSVRPPQLWLDSFLSTIWLVITRPLPPDLPEGFRPLFDLAEEVVGRRTFGAGFRDATAEQLLAAYEAHNDEVRATVPADRLLEFDVAQGWGPLCAFLEVPVPATAFPQANDRAMFASLFSLGDDAPARPATTAEVEDRFRQATGR